MIRARIHPTAIVDARAELGDEVEIGPYAIVEAGARVGSRTKLLAHAVIHGAASLGDDNVVHPFAVIGGAPQAKRHTSPSLRVEIGDRNVFREHVTVQAGTERATRIGSDNLFMVSAHVAHDTIIGSSCVFANAVLLAGHAVIEDHVTFGGAAGVVQFVRVGESAFVAGGARCERDVPPFVIAQGDRARVRALNKVGLQRRGFSPETIARLERAFKALYVRKLPIAEALRTLDRSDPHVDRLARALESGTLRESSRPR